MTKPIAYVTGYHDGYPVIQPTDGAAVLPVGMALYDHPPVADVQPVAWSVFDKRTQKHWYTNEAVKKAGYYAKEYSHREPDGSPSMVVVPLYEHPPAADALELVEALRALLRGIFDGPDESDAVMIVNNAKAALAKWEGK